MTEHIDDFYRDLSKLVKQYEQLGLALKIESSDSGMIKIFDQRITPLARAKSGLDDIIELAHTTAEHHSYWQALEGCTGVADSILDKWDGLLSADDLSEIDWALKNLVDAMVKIKEDNVVYEKEGDYIFK